METCLYVFPYNLKRTNNTLLIQERVLINNFMFNFFLPPPHYICYQCATKESNVTLLSSAVSNQTPLMMTPDEVKKCRSDLIQHYGEVMSGIHTDVFNPDSRVKFEDIYTNLYLLKEVEKEKDNEGSNAPKRHAIFARV